MRRELAPLTERRLEAKQRLDAAATKPVRYRIGFWLWLTLLGSGLALEITAFADGDNNLPTLSQLAKRLERAGGIASAAAFTTFCLGGGVVLFLHWVVQAF